MSSHVIPLTRLSALSQSAPDFPVVRPRRLRQSPQLRAMVRETRLAATDLIYPLFAVSGRGVRSEISSMPGVFNLSADQVAQEAREISRLGIPAVLLFGIPPEKDPVGRDNFSPAGVVQQAIRAIK